jgi:hypothetical protein
VLRDESGGRLGAKDGSDEGLIIGQESKEWVCGGVYTGDGGSIEKGGRQGAQTDRHDVHHLGQTARYSECQVAGRKSADVLVCMHEYLFRKLDSPLLTCQSDQTSSYCQASYV